MDQSPGLPDPSSSITDAASTAVVTGDLCFHGVRFSYPSRPNVPVLEGISLTFPANKVTALVGASGSGKSTTIALLERWYEPSEGHITMHGRRLDGYNVRWLRRQMRLVQQEPVLFSEPIFDNVAKGLVGTEQEHVDPEAKLISDPRILLLDEATGALDVNSEAVVQAALDEAAKGRTTIVIAHQLTTVMKADGIIVMHEGKVVEQGSHPELLEMGGRYAALVKAQELGASPAKLRIWN
ncbi:ATP-binding cassette multidrug transport protein [Teratosphaeria destructans]|uniref:ATP-binding cassette multidrug transport protein n=1 Tax=Teratosphaeria destructans TaxID=418781 RepID=A0A9W7W396_9PEZI|nr:ATP-binding cassette multidrug transport protein [Teratosphaeria destructans]